MKELNEVLLKPIQELTKEDLVQISEDLSEILDGIDVTSLQTTDYEFEWYGHFDLAFLAMQKIIESTSEGELKDRIEVESNFGHILSFLLTLQELREEEYTKHKADIYFEFLVIFPSYLTDLSETLKRV